MKNHIEQANYIKSEFSRYLKSELSISDPDYNREFLDKLNQIESKLYKGPYLVSTFPFKQSSSMNELISEGLFSEDFHKIGSLDFDRPCYEHQIKSFRQLKSGHSVVVTTGTGSGKTECFMLPIIDELLREPEHTKLLSGVRTIFLFPLNALVYDQIDRLRSYLKDCPELTFGFYTGRTPEDSISKEGRRQLETYKRKFGEPLKNELLTREQMRKTPPKILFTNYSMLEYLLIRPTDSSIISKDALKNLKYIVLDEAHTYRGALGIEVSLLLRRLTGMAERRPQYVLTSATLGKGEEDIAKIKDFAHNLTSASYANEDIVFGIREDTLDKPKYTIDPIDYPKMLSGFDGTNNDAELIKTFEKYQKYDSSKGKGTNLFSLLKCDKNTTDLYRLTKNVNNFYDTKKDLLNFDDESLTALIELVSKCNSDDTSHAKKLYDVKYHMFVKAPDGAFITIGDQKELSLLACNQINGNKAFKIGICHNCKVPYIMGITKDDYLCIDDEIDIDESYAMKARRLEYYLIADCLSEDELADVSHDKDFEKFYACSKCGFLKSASSAMSNNDCEHFETSRTTLYKFIGKSVTDLDDDDISINNLHRCPVCDYRANGGGVITGFHVGKDRATTLIAQILYESMNRPVKYEKIEGGLFGSTEKKIEGRKQFLAFSDSRQQAAFFAKFLNQNNDRFMKKIVLWRTLEDNKHESIPYIDLIESLTRTFQQKFHYTLEEARKHAKAAALWELLLVDGRHSGEGIGLFSFELNLEKFEHYYDDKLLESALKSNNYENITPQQFRDLTSVILMAFRQSPSIDYGTFPTDDFEEKKELLGYQHYPIYITLQDTKSKGEDRPSFYPVKSLLPVEESVDKKRSVNNLVKYVMKAFDYDIVKAKQLITLVFQTAVIEKVIKENPILDYGTTYLIDAENYKLHSCKETKYYKCSKCGRLTRYNINNHCVNGDCSGELSECNADSDEHYSQDFYRSKYIDDNRPAEKLICREHTAQINADEAKAIQDDFKNCWNGKINFISCSTTFEMGIDLGALNTIFMRNIPPTPANYAQRAGRAGRRAETSAFILTFCGNSSHDYTYFDQPREMVRGLVDPPHFVIENDKIIMRHITAAAFSLYFRDADHRDDFDSIEHFIDENVTAKFFDYVKRKPVELGSYIDEYILKDTKLYDKYSNFKWIDYLDASRSALNSMTDGVGHLKELYEEAKEYAWKQRWVREALSYEEALSRMNSKNSLINYFTKYNVIPGYGFPVDTVELHIYDLDRRSMNEEYNLDRNLSIAISEYAPGSEVIVDEKKYTSRYLFLPHNDYALPTTYYCECKKCHTINKHESREHFSDDATCQYCGTRLDVTAQNVSSYITPIYGFIADQKNKNTRRTKPFKTYASDVYYVGDSLETQEELNNVVAVKEYSNEELLVLNESNFFMCRHCGYTDLDRRFMASSKVKEHKEYKGISCKGDGKLERIHLGYSYRTDIVTISFKHVDSMIDYDTALSVLYAILEGISITYNIERGDIGGLVFSSNETRPFTILLYDTVSGGAGHVKRLLDDSSLLAVLKNALRKTSQDCCDEDTSCYNCLRNYGNQRYHNHIKRGLAKQTLEDIISRLTKANGKFVISGYNLAYQNTPFSADTSTELLSDEVSKEAFAELVKELNLKALPTPDYYGCTLTCADGPKKRVYADFAWAKQKKLLFSLSNIDSFNELDKLQNEYDCYLLSDNFDYIGFSKGLTKENK